MEIRYVSAEEMALVDTAATKKYSLTVDQLMENVGRNVARFVADTYLSRHSVTAHRPSKVVCLYGKGNNGADSLCCARFLRIYGFDVSIVPAFEGRGNENVEHQLKTLVSIGIKPLKRIPPLQKKDLIIDGLLGFRLKGSPRDGYASLIEESNGLRSQGIRVLSIDIPSGMDPNSGKTSNPGIYPDYTLTLGLPKKGMKGNQNLGKLFIVNIGIPPELFERELGFEPQLYFKHRDVVPV